MRDEANGFNDLIAASKEKQTEEHDVIDEALSDRGDGYTVFSIPVGLLFRPSANKLRNLKTKDYLGTAKLVAATDDRDAFTGFTGLHRANSDGGMFRNPLPEQRIGLIRSKTTVVRDAISTSGSSKPTIEPIYMSVSTKLATRRRSHSTGAIEGQRAQSTLNGGSLMLGLKPSQLLNNNEKNQPPTPPDSVQSRTINFSRNVPLPKPSVPRNVIDSYYANVYDGVEVEQEYTAALATSGQAPERTANWAESSRAAPRPPQELSRSTSLSHSLSNSNSNYSPPMTRNQPMSSPELGRNNSNPQYRPSFSTTVTPVFARAATGITGYSEHTSESGYGGIMMTMRGEGEEKELRKIRIKLNYRNEMRGMVSPCLQRGNRS